MMLNSLLLFSVAIGVSNALPTNDVFERQVIGNPCTDIRIFSARGTGEDYSASSDPIVQYLVPAVCNGRSSCDYADIVYPATTDNTQPGYCGDSEQEGVLQAVKQITNHMTSCPGTRMVLAGYSQGAELLADVLGGTLDGTTCQAGNGPLDPSTLPGSAITAAVLFADITRTAGQSFDYGSAGSGVSGRFGARGGSSLTALNAYAARLASYCSTDDYWCATGAGDNAINVHSSSVEDNYVAAAAFINGKLG